MLIKSEEEPWFSRIEKLAELYLEYKDKIIETLKELSDDELAELPSILEETHKDSYGFRATYIDDIADQSKFELHLRQHLSHAKELNINYYCTSCSGECKGDDEHTKNSSKMSPLEMKINEMSRGDLIEEVLRLHKLTIRVEK